MKLNGTIFYNGNAESFNGETHIAIAAVKLLLVDNPNLSMSDVDDFFKPGLSGTPRNHFLITENDYNTLTKKHWKDKYLHDYPVTDVNTKTAYYVSNQFSNKYNDDNLPSFIDYLLYKGFTFDFTYNAPELKRNNRNNNDSHINGVPFGADDTGYYVRYDDSILDENKVIGLTHFLETEYEAILGFARHLLGEIVGDNLRRIPVILKEGTPKDSYSIDDKTIAKIIYKRINEKNKNIPEEEILSILKKKNYSLHRLGEYYSNSNMNLDQGPYIVIYYKNLSCDNFDEYKAKLVQCLAHEYLHFIHDMYSNVFKENSFKAKCVKEASADFFSMLYLLTPRTSAKRIEVAEDRYNWWIDMIDFELPYAYAMWFYHVNGLWNSFDKDDLTYVLRGITDKFKRVFEISKDNMDDSFDLLVD